MSGLLCQIDQKIIEILNNNAKTPSKEIAAELEKSGHNVSNVTIRSWINYCTANNFSGFKIF